MAKYEPSECGAWRSKTLIQIEEGQAELAALRRQIRECFVNVNTQALDASLDDAMKQIKHAKSSASSAEFS